MSEWHPVTTPPQEVGLYQLNDPSGVHFLVRWDGRNFRFTSGTFAGSIVVHFKGDLWRSVGGEGK